MIIKTNVPEVITFGCRLNAYDSEIIRASAEIAGAKDTVIINTCAVTSEAERQARQAIRSLRRKQPNRRIFVTGCAAQIHPSQFLDMPEVDRVIGNSVKYLAEPFQDKGKRNQVQEFKDYPARDISSLRNFVGHSRAYVQIQNGCDHRCTFCIIPKGRGPSRSIPVDKVISEAKSLLDIGVSEIVLTGVNITSWGRDLGEEFSLGHLVRQLLLKLPDLQRLRLTSLDPAEIDQELWFVIAEDERLLPHLHLSLQSGDDLVLKRMKRRHLRSDEIAICNLARQLRPGIALGADLIAGFPTECDTAFNNTLSLVDECDLNYLHVFPYSTRPGTPASRMPQVSVEIRRERAAQLRARGVVALQCYLDQQIGKKSYVLVEKFRNGVGFARADNYAPVTLLGNATVGEVLPVVFTMVDSGRLVASTAI